MPLQDRLEPEVKARVDELPDLPVQDMAALSTAISLKRIADRLDDIASGDAKISVTNHY